MEYPQIEKYEYKSPSYKLKKRENIEKNIKEHIKRRRFILSDDNKYYKSINDNKDEISLVFAGDLLCLENMIDKYSKKEGGYDFSLCFKYVKPIFEKADFVCGNLETVISQTAPYRGEILTHEGPYYCNAPYEYLQALSLSGFDMLTTANNHTIDAGVRGIVDTINNIKEMGIIQTGTFLKKEDKFVIVDICGIKVGFTAFSTSYNKMQLNLNRQGRINLLNTYTKNRAQSVFDKMKEKGAEITVCFPHWGKEYTSEITIRQYSIAQNLTEIGYDFVVGSHAHVIQKFEEINNKPVLFSLGNLISHLNTFSDSNFSEYTILYNLKLKRENGKIKSIIEFIPCKIVKNYKGIPFTVLPVNEHLGLTEEKVPILKNTYEDVFKLLENNDVILNTNIDVSLESMKEIDKNEDKDINKILQTLKNEKKSISKNKTIKISIPEITKSYKFNSYKQEKEGLYEIYDDYAALHSFLSVSSVVKLSENVDDKPVYYINNDIEANDSTRLVYLGKQTKIIGKETFKNFTNLESVRFFDNVTKIEENAFENCKKMSGLWFPESLEYIEKNAFLNCENLLSVKIPPSVISIDKEAFIGCNNLTIYCEKGSYADKFANENNICVKYMPLSTKKDSKPVVDKKLLGKMNGLNDKHPSTIIATCCILGTPLPYYAKCKNQPSKYIKYRAFDGTLESIVKLLGNKMPEIDKEELEKKYKAFKRKYKSQKNLKYNNVNLTVYFCDWLLYCRQRGFTHNCYFDYELYNKEPDIRDTFLNEGYRKRVHKACNKKEYRKIFLDKALFNETFKKYVKRDWIDVSTCSFDEFNEFIQKHEEFFAKPVRGTGGAGARVIKRDSDSANNLFKICKDEGLIIEEIIKQNSEIAKFNQSTLNTVRMYTLVCADKSVKVMGAVARFGRAGNVIDNFHGGGVAATIDIESGVVSQAINRAHIRTDIHPDSREVILGFKYPYWEKVKEAVCDAALKVPQMRHIGWDVCVTENGDIEFVEGNGKPNFDVLQSPDQIGKKYIYEEKIREIENIEGIKPIVYDKIMINTKNMEIGFLRTLPKRFKRKIKRIINN